MNVIMKYSYCRAAFWEDDDLGQTIRGAGSETIVLDHGCK
jgi:hypothetical protein